MELVYLIEDRTAWINGYGSDAIRELDRCGIVELGIAKIPTDIFVTKINSAQPILNAGFTLMATISSHVVCDGQRITFFTLSMRRCSRERLRHE